MYKPAEVNYKERATIHLQGYTEPDITRRVRNYLKLVQ